MAYNNGPKIVTDGLVLCLDAADRNSYPGTGSTWYDLSGNGYHGTINGATLSDNAFNFDGTNDYIELTTTSSLNFGADNFTMFVWALNNPPSSTHYSVLLTKKTGFAVSGGFILYSPPQGDIYPARFYIDNQPQTTSPFYGTSDTNDVWKHFCITRNGSSFYIYVNSSLERTATLTGADMDNTTHTIKIGVRHNTSTDALEQYYTGTISSVLIYDKYFSADEISQNYNATKGRFGL